jgi:hypothetical protein
MNRIVTKLKHEFSQVIFTAIFFFITFQLIAYTRDLYLQQHGIHVNSLVAAAISALVIAKVVVVVNILPFMNRFPDKPLIYNILWKTWIYILAALVVRYVGSIFPHVMETRDFVQANNNLLDAFIWPRFWAMQIWLSVLFFIYVALRELVRVLGRERVTRMFFGPV